ncbi:glycosyltransferase family 61 protein [Mucilaginibacter psychrotolerans]|uniref:Glycosyltransferase family 61 protein n=1 Tax=Mucilaginibacter psychrotolerans TaxID=1524096 RepID=A0A4Y8SEN5_9SPHI|nr:glycosyltransferase family 61 protein [Mucilaginibacter psychrotolerans]TFF37085.1 glycosyltransferase family 61 protein [Mucilaginibacter psychrotolerans]
MKHLIMKLIKAAGIKKTLMRLRDLALRFYGLRVLNERKTINFLQPYLVAEGMGNTLLLPQTANSGEGAQVIFAEKEITTQHTYVWEYQQPGKTAWVTRNGSPIVEKRVICIDGNFSFYRDIWKPDTRPTQNLPAVIVLFSQLQDGIMFGGYYDFVFLVAAKLCRIQDAIADTAGIAIAYPLFNTAYEADFMQLLDVEPLNLIDTRHTKPVSPRVITGNIAYWYPTLDDINSLKLHIAKKISPKTTAPKRIYISRVGRRHVVNEAEVLLMLQKYNFEVIEDKRRSIAEQIEIYHNAAFILGPHGASFSNMIWCQPGAHLMELFSPNYMPDFFAYLAVLMDMQYSAFYSGTANKQVAYLDGLVEDIHVDVAELETSLQKILQPKVIAAT